MVAATVVVVVLAAVVVVVVAAGAKVEAARAAVARARAEVAEGEVSLRSRSARPERRRRAGRLPKAQRGSPSPDSLSLSTPSTIVLRFDTTRTSTVYRYCTGNKCLSATVTPASPPPFLVSRYGCELLLL